MRRFKFETPEGDMAALEFGNPAERLAAVWLHATGFNAMTYQSILAPLGLRTKVQAVDLRGHGRSTLPAVPSKLKSWARYRDDMIAYLKRESPTKPVILGGHSMGAVVALMVAGKVPERVAGLVLVDPVILAPRQYMSIHMMPFASLFMGKHPLATQAGKRRRKFGSKAEIEDSYTGRGAFKTWREPFLADYLIDGCDRVDDNPPDSEDQTWELLCHPKWESATFSAQRNRPWGALAKVRKHKIPITILQPERGSVMTEAVANRLVRKCPHLQLKVRKNTTHFLPMEAPYDVRDHLSEFIAARIEGMSSAEFGRTRRTLRVGD